MEKFTTLTATAAAFTRQNVDTDAIVPKQFLKTIKRTGLAAGLFYDLRHHTQSTTPHGEFVLDQKGFENSQILVAGANFGCGSSREHAPWALLDFGIRTLIAPSFADIFYNNCFKNGILPITLPQAQVDELAKLATPTETFEVDLPNQKVTAGGKAYGFEIDPFRKRCLLEGLDDIALTLEKKPQLTEYEARHRQQFPWLW